VKEEIGTLQSENHEITFAEVEQDLRQAGGQDVKHHLVTVTVDSLPKQVRPGRYLVSLFKKAVGVDPTYELEELVNGKLVALADDAHVRIRGGESFVSHVRGGASS
jgi:hypothetical protein